MDISNDTTLDAKYKVSGGGTPMGPHGHFFPEEEAAHWPVIPAGSVIRQTPTSKGPWKVYFYVNGHGIVVETNSQNDLVHLVPSGDAFRADVRRVVRSG